MAPRKPRGRTFELRDGKRVRLRPVVPDDKAILAAAVARMSDESRYRRFFSYTDKLSSAELAYLTEIDHVDHEALVALDPKTGAALGVARFIRLADDPTAAEVAFAVVDDWQGRGLGRLLLTELTKRARAEGIVRFSAWVQFENQASVAMVKGIGTSERRSVGPESEIVSEIPPERGLGVQLSALLQAAAEGAVSVGQAAMTQTLSSAQRPRSWNSISTVLVGSDGSPTAETAVRAAIDVAAKFGARLHVLSVYRGHTERPAALAHVAAVAGRAKEAGVSAEGHAELGDPGDTLLAFAADHGIDLLVVGNKGMSGPASLLGSVPRSVAQHAPCSVMVVRTV